MPGPSETEQYLLQQVRAGRPEAWSRLIERYQGRLLSFARRQLGQDADAEDAVQETFMRFVRSLDRFRADASLETYLFTILRRYMIDQFRSRPRKFEDVRKPHQPGIVFTGAADGSGEGFDVAGALPANDPTASWHARRDEQEARMAETLGAVLAQLTEQLRHERAFDQLQMMELLFAAQLPNSRVAELIDVPVQRVGVTKHRWLKRLAHGVARRRGQGHTPGRESDHDPAVERELLERSTLLTRVWQQQRPTCPKRTTLGQYLLHTLEPAWRDYVGFHLDTLGCRFCRANLDDLEAQTSAAEAHATLHRRIMASTAGFFREG